jgi:fumarylpyruvate hydrolase
MAFSVFDTEAAAHVSTLPILEDARLFPVRRVYCVGRNYVEHIREMGEADEREPPFFFQKPSDSVSSDGVVPYPSCTDDLQYEVELVVAIGKRARSLQPADSLSIIYGYAVGLDMTRRDRQRESVKKSLPWEIGKSFDASAPSGPIHPVSVVGHINSGIIRLVKGSEVRQNSTLDKMIWNVPEIVAQLSRQYTLMPGDLIFTGTPAGVGPVMPGDELVATVANLAPLHVRIVA